MTPHFRDARERGTHMTGPAGRARAESREFHRLGGQPLIGRGRIVTWADPARSGSEFGLTSHDESASLQSAVCVESDDVDARVPRFFGRGPDGYVVDVPDRR